MPIRTLQQQQAQVGRIRIGRTVPGAGGKRARPERLDRFRFTTQSEALARAVAACYGGPVERWTPEGRPAEWEVVSTARTLPVLVPPRPVSQFYEMWSGAGCMRRCDGEVETISGDACLCPLDPAERGDLAKDGRACKATTRLNVMLPELPGIGVWRLDSHGYYAAIELPLAAEFLGAAIEQGGYVRATLALEERQVRRPGVGVRTFLVPALHVDVTPEQLLAGGGIALGAGASRASLPPGSSPALPAAAGESAEERSAHADRLALAARQASDVDAIKALWREMTDHGLAEETVGDEQGIVEPLDGYLRARGDELVTGQPVQSNSEDRPALDADVLWQQVIASVPPGWSTSDTREELARHAGVPFAVATPEQMAAFLDGLVSGAVA